jgi:hypothetical protein
VDLGAPYFAGLAGIVFNGFVKVVENAHGLVVLLTVRRNPWAIRGPLQRSSGEMPAELFEKLVIWQRHAQRGMCTRHSGT